MKYVIYGSTCERRNSFIYDIISKSKNSGRVYSVTTACKNISQFSIGGDKYIVLCNEDNCRGRRLDDYKFLIEDYSDENIGVAISNSYSIPISWEDYLKKEFGVNYIVELL